MSFLQKILRLKFRQYPLYLEAFLIAGAVRLLILFIPFRFLSFLLGSVQRSSASDDFQISLAVDEIATAVSRIAIYTPWRCECFEQGLTAKILLKQRGIPSTLVFGVAHTSQKAIQAHAWLRCGKRIVTGGKGREAFHSIAHFS